MMRTYVGLRPLVAGLFLGMLAVTIAGVAAADEPKREFRAGAFAIDISPLEFPVIVNGGMTERTVD